MSYCINCGTKLPENAKFCPECGQRVGSTNINAGRKVIYSPKAENIRVEDPDNEPKIKVKDNKQQPNVVKIIAIILGITFIVFLILLWLGGQLIIIR